MDDCWAAVKDHEAFQLTVPPLLEAAMTVDAARAAEVLDRIAGLFEVVPAAPAGQLALLASVLVRRGASPEVATRALGHGLIEALTGADAFAGSWFEMFGPKVALPHPDGDQAIYQAAVEKLTKGRRFPRRPGLARADAVEVTNGWFTLGDWALAAEGLFEFKEARLAMPRRDWAAACTQAMSVLRRDVAILAAELAVLDDETLIVVHRTEPVAFEVRVSGVMENFQLYVLLADALPGFAPDPAWVAAAGTGDPDGSDRIEAAFQLSDRYGNYVPIEGRPGDIPAVDDRRLLVIDPPPFGRSWDLGRRPEAVVPEVVLERTLDAGEAAAWQAKAGPLLLTAERQPSHFHYSRQRGVVELTA